MPSIKRRKKNRRDTLAEIRMLVICSLLPHTSCDVLNLDKTLHYSPAKRTVKNKNIWLLVVQLTTFAGLRTIRIPEYHLHGNGVAVRDLPGAG